MEIRLKTKGYESPEVQLVELNTEGVFAASSGETGIDDLGGWNDWDNTDPLNW